jgi:hypothetical protein
MQVHLFNWVKEEIFLHLFVFCYAKWDTADVPWHYNKGGILQYVIVS